MGYDFYIGPWHGPDGSRDPDDPEYPERMNANCLRADPVPDHLWSYRLSSSIPPHEAMVLADSLEHLLMTSREMRSHPRAQEVQDLADWLRYWADLGREVHSC